MRIEPPASSARCARAAIALGLTLALAPEARANGRFPASSMVVTSPTNPSRMAVRATYGLLLSSDAGSSWEWVCEKALGYGGAEDPSVVITASGAIVVGMFRETARSLDGGCTWQRDPAWPKAVVDLALRRASPHTVFAASCAYSRPGDAGASLFDDAVRVSDDDGATWTTRATLDPTLLLDSVEVAESDPNVVYVSAIRARGKDTTGVLLTSTDGGAHFREHAVPYTPSDRGVYIAAVDPTNAARVYLRVASVDAGRLLVTDDAGATLREAYRGGTLSGFALADEGRTVYLGGPKDGLLRASAGELSFAAKNPMPIQCLASVGSALWACAPSSVGYVLGASSDGGGSFAPKLRLAGMRGPLACPGGTMADTCAVEWRDLRALVDPRLPAPAATKGAVDASTAASTPATKSACGCSTPGAPPGRTAASFAIAALFAWTASRRSRRPRR